LLCMQEGGGENNSPRQFCLLGQSDSGPAMIFLFFSGPGWCWPSQFIFWARLILAQPCLLGRVWPRRK
jgi:hypothetical protein